MGDPATFYVVCINDVFRQRVRDIQHALFGIERFPEGLDPFAFHDQEISFNIYRYPGEDIDAFGGLEEAITLAHELYIEYPELFPIWHISEDMSHIGTFATEGYVDHQEIQNHVNEYANRTNEVDYHLSLPRKYEVSFARIGRTG